MALKVYQGVGNKIVCQQSDHAQHTHLKDNGTFLGIKPEWNFFRLTAFDRDCFSVRYSGHLVAMHTFRGELA